MTAEWQRYADDITTKVGWRTIVRKHFVLPDGTRAEFDTVANVGTNTVAVIALTTDNQVVIAEQFRPGPEKVMQDLPGGMVDPGETPLDAIKRELLEETGYGSDDWQELGVVQDDGYSNIHRHFFLARDCHVAASQALEETEFITVRLLSIDELIQCATSGSMTDGIAVLYAYDELTKRKGNS